MYLKSVSFNIGGELVEFAYPKRISRDELEFREMIFLNLVSTEEGELNKEVKKIDLRKKSVNVDGQDYLIKPIAIKNKSDCKFLIRVYSIQDNKLKLIREHDVKLSKKNKSVIYEVFCLSAEEIRAKIDKNYISSMKVLFFSSEINEEMFQDIGFCVPNEIYENNEKEYFEIESFVDIEYLGRLLEDSVDKKYGFSNVFHRKKAYSILEVIKESKFKFDENKILKKLKEENKKMFVFNLSDVVVQK